MSEKMSDGPYQCKDSVLHRNEFDEVKLTESGAITICSGGRCVCKSIREWVDMGWSTSDLSRLQRIADAAREFDEADDAYRKDRLTGSDSLEPLNLRVVKKMALKGALAELKKGDAMKTQKEIAVATRVARRLNVFERIGNELDRAYAKHGAEQWGRHEWYAILKEEVDEAWDAVKADSPQEELEKEIVQIAAMCFRYLETRDRYREPAALSAAPQQEAKGESKKPRIVISGTPNGELDEPGDFKIG